MRYLLRLIALFLVVMAARAHAGDLVVVVNRDSNVNAMSRDDVVNIFMGRYRRLPSGLPALPVDLGGEKEAFYQRLVNRTPSEINSYWARLVFSGRGSPPQQLSSPQEVLEIVELNRGAIGYVPATETSDQVRVVLTLPASD